MFLLVFLILLSLFPVNISVLRPQDSVSCGFSYIGLFTTLLGTHVRGVLSQLKFQPLSFCLSDGYMGNDATVAA